VRPRPPAAKPMDVPPASSEPVANVATVIDEKVVATKP
jgi:hypothetical protein